MGWIKKKGQTLETFTVEQLLGPADCQAHRRQNAVPQLSARIQTYGKEFQGNVCKKMNSVFHILNLKARTGIGIENTYLLL